jgi:predicted transcriptional regulator
MTATTSTTSTKKVTAFSDHDDDDYSFLFSLIIKAISENMGKGTEYNNNLIDDPGATLTKIVTGCRLSYPQTKYYLQLLADQGLVTIGIYQKRRAHKKGKEIKRPTVMTVKITDKGYKYLQEEGNEEP